MRVAAVLVAAGHGVRFGAGRPKQFLPLAGKPLLYWPLRAFQRTPAVKSVVLVTARAFIPWARSFVRREKLSKVTAVVEGGAARADSVRAGVAAAPKDADVVLVHDAARALVTPEIISRVAVVALKTGCALAAWPVPDTLKRGRPGGRKVARTVPRENMWLAQTPQGFRRDVLSKVFRGKASAGTTDDVQRAERAGLPVALVPASPTNFKVTLPEDFAHCRALMKGQK